jgi:hypothetical protein
MLPKRGRPPVVFMMTVEQELRSEDLFKLEVMNDHPLTAPPVIQRLREIHHRAACEVASGKTMTEVAIATGRSPARIMDLCRDPAFKELISYYRTQIEEVDISLAALAMQDYKDINDLARGELIKRLEDPAKMGEIPVDELRHLMITTGDRTTMPPKIATPGATIPVKITFNMGNRDIRPKGELDGELRGELVIEGETQDETQTETPSESQDDD